MSYSVEINFIKGAKVEQLKDLPSWGVLAKTVALFIGRTILVLLGVTFITEIIYGLFEGDLSLAELSLLEFAFIAACFYRVRRYLHHSNLTKKGFFIMIFLPLKHFGWYPLIIIAASLILYLTGTVSEHDLMFNSLSPYEHRIQLFEMGLFLIIIHLVTPKILSEEVDMDSNNQPLTSNDTNTDEAAL